MTRKRKTKKSKRKRSRREPGQDSVVHQYEITDEPIDLDKVPEEIEEDLEELYFAIQGKVDQATIDRLESLIKKFPSVPQFYNFLSVAYSAVGEVEKSEKIARLCYAKMPDYLFAKISLAEICLQKGEISKIPEIFEHKFDLKVLYPERNQFHSTEYVSFMGVMGLYFVACGDISKAETYYGCIKDNWPNQPMTQRLGARIRIESLKWKMIGFMNKGLLRSRT